jgi:hypothetical protein
MREAARRLNTKPSMVAPPPNSTSTAMVVVRARREAPRAVVSAFWSDCCPRA